MRRPLVIYDFATAPFWISLYLRKIWFSFLLVYFLVKIVGYTLSAKFDVEGNSVGSYPGWYNWPVDMLIGGQGQVRRSRHYFTFLGKVQSSGHYTVKHRVGRVLSFFSSSRNWDSPNPSPAGKGAPPPRSVGRGTFAGERGVGRVPIPTRGHTLWYSLYIRTLFRQANWKGR